MAKVYAKFVGGVQKELTVETVADVKREMNAENSTVTVSGEAKSDSFKLEDGAFVVLSEQVKGNMGKIIAKTADKQLVIVKQDKHKKYSVNGTVVTGKQLEKIALAILAELGYE